MGYGFGGGFGWMGITMVVWNIVGILVIIWLVQQISKK